MVVSQNFSAATSLAMLAPMRTLTSMPIFSLMTSEISVRPWGPASIPWETGCVCVCVCVCVCGCERERERER